MLPLRDNEIVTVIGGSGFIGRDVCELLLKAGVRVRVAERDPRRAYFLRPLAITGQIGFVAADVTRPETLRGAFDGSAAVVNLAGAFGRRAHAVNAQGAGNAAAAARDAGARAFVHVSAIAADAASDSDYASSKGEGEAGVRIAFPRATILRPGLVFGADDALTNRFATLASRLPILPVIAPEARFQPVFVRDLARAIAAAALDAATHGGKSYDIVGPEVMTMRALNARIAAMAGQSATLVDVPDIAASAMASLGFLPGAPITRDQLMLLRQGSVAGHGARGLEAFAIVPTPLDTVAPEWLARFHQGGRFAHRAPTGDAAA